MWNDDKVKITPIEEMEGLQFAVHYFDDKKEIFISPSICKKLETGEMTELKFVMLSWERYGRSIHDDMTVIVDKFKSMPTGEISFDRDSLAKNFLDTLTGKQRIIVSPTFSE